MQEGKTKWRQKRLWQLWSHLPKMTPKANWRFGKSNTRVSRINHLRTKSIFEFHSFSQACELSYGAHLSRDSELYWVKTTPSLPFMDIHKAASTSSVLHSGGGKRAKCLLWLQLEIFPPFFSCSSYLNPYKYFARIWEGKEYPLLCPLPSRPRSQAVSEGC